jgi:hypothetical protein
MQTHTDPLLDFVLALALVSAMGNWSVLLFFFLLQLSDFRKKIYFILVTVGWSFNDKSS